MISFRKSNQPGCRRACQAIQKGLDEKLLILGMLRHYIQYIWRWLHGQPSLLLFELRHISWGYSRSGYMHKYGNQHFFPFLFSSSIQSDSQALYLGCHLIHDHLNFLSRFGTSDVDTGTAGSVGFDVDIWFITLLINGSGAQLLLLLRNS